MKERSTTHLKSIIFVFALIGVIPVYSNCYGQEKREYNNYYELENELRGAYQIQMLGVRTKPSISNDLLEQVKLHQQQSSRTFLNYREHIRVEIISKDEMNNGIVFTPEELIIYLNEGEY